MRFAPTTKGSFASLAAALLVCCARSSETKMPVAASPVVPDAGTTDAGATDAGTSDAGAAEASWEWATSLVKGLETHPGPLTFPADAWTTKGRLTLWVDARYLWDGAPPRCTALDAVPEDGALNVHYAESFGKKAGAIDEPTAHLVLDEHATLQGTTTREADGSVSAFECSSTLGALSDVSRDALRYRATIVSLEFACRMTDLERDRRCPQCVRCKPTLFFGRPPLRISASPSLKMADVDAAPACVPCSAPDEGPALVDRLRRAVKGHYVRVPQDGPAFFRTAASCESDLGERVRKRLVPIAYDCNGPMTH
ncbi:hypothetical protein AKJ09_04527 [Labilithrix luteola]|uniref:Lipoprotein n=1 Tax=Labilithrix luteola TaxID=1391654 RepID=A0A0K1PWF9_9BACT|nr:hypothetical protein [Labilithrix luteola]AKU97863.1 hypothetical protein AKJ09_04527 [Labilithrix luteola]